MSDYRDYQNPNTRSDPPEIVAPSTGGGIGILLALGVILLFIIGIAMFGTGSPTTVDVDPTAPTTSAPADPGTAPALNAPAEQPAAPTAVAPAEQPAAPAQPANPPAQAPAEGQ